MNYKKIYDQLIERAQHSPRPKQGSERHHIVPKCLGGSDEDSNLVRLSFLEHIWAHIWLAEIYPDVFGLQLSVGWTLTGHPEAYDFEPTEELIQETVKSKERARKMQSEQMKGNTLRLGKNHSEETKSKMSESLSGQKHPMFGKSHSKDSKKRMSENGGGCGTLPWRTPAALRSPKSLQVWFHADDYFKLWKEHRCGYKKLAKLFEVSVSQTHRSLVLKFRAGWVPSEDSDWLDFRY